MAVKQDHPQDRLRPLAVTVEEPQAGVFAWALLEHRGTGWKTVDEARARAVRSTYREAMADGLLALQKRVDDLDTGPRMQELGLSDEQSEVKIAEEAAEMDASDGADASRTRARRTHGSAQDGSAKAPAQGGKRLFGFGPLV